MSNPNEDRLRALELLQREDVHLTAYDMGTLAAIKRFSPVYVARVDAVERIEASRVRKRAARNRKPTTTRRKPSVFDPQPVDDGERLLP